MSETKFTPGPWSVDLSDNGDMSVGIAPSQPVVFKNIPNMEHRYIEIAIVGSTFYDNAEDGDPLFYGDWDANAHLIAAAPDLYAALEKMLTCSEGVEKDMAFDAAAAALAKARGEV